MQPSQTSNQFPNQSPSDPELPLLPELSPPWCSLLHETDLLPSFRPPWWKLPSESAVLPVFVTPGDSYPKNFLTYMDSSPLVKVTPCTSCTTPLVTLVKVTLGTSCTTPFRPSLEKSYPMKFLFYETSSATLQNSPAHAFVLNHYNATVHWLSCFPQTLSTPTL